jgi:hypothetical protein
MMDKTMGSRHAPPIASSMIETLRGLGYTTATALADIIDNSISAGAETVSISFSFKGTSSTITILDDGKGMSPEELDRAMRLGEINPLDERASNDLGRFGIGLKTASFSQCRRLTVTTKKQGESSCLRWDLDLLAASPGDGWFLLEGPAEGSEELLLPIADKDHGTLVLWELLDRIVTPGYSEQDFLDLIDRVERHLAMVFHRYLEPQPSQLKIIINGRPVAPWNPFLSSNSATWSSPIENLLGGIVVQCHVLPHRDRLGQREYDNASGPDGWTAQQGFYVYRSRRLLVAGSWLGLGEGRSWTKEEAHRLVRNSLDIPNSADADWKIDIRKSVARPPVNVRERLVRLADDARQRARRVFAHRGKVVRSWGAEPVIQAWRVERSKGGMRYRIDEQHPAVMAVLDEAVPTVSQVRTMLRILEETIPIQRIWLDTTEAKEVPLSGFSGEPPAEVMAVLKVMYRNMIRKKGLTPESARDQLLRTEPFHNYPYLVAALSDEMIDKE